MAYQWTCFYIIGTSVMKMLSQCCYHIETNSLLKQIETLTFIVGSLQIHPLFIEYSLGYRGNINLSVTDIRFLEVHNAHFSLLFGRY